MELRRSSTSGFLAKVELDTGTYVADHFSWMEFKMSDELRYNKGAFMSVNERYKGNANTKMEDEGKELRYLGMQSQRMGDALDGCLVFAYAGDYEQIAKGNVEKQ